MPCSHFEPELTILTHEQQVRLEAVQWVFDQAMPVVSVAGQAHRNAVVGVVEKTGQVVGAGSLGQEGDTIQAAGGRKVRDSPEIRPVGLGSLAVFRLEDLESAAEGTGCSAVVEMEGIVEVDGSHLQLASAAADRYEVVGAT